MVKGGPVLVYFGRKWENPMLDAGMWLRVKVPMGWRCLRCSEPIDASDRGIFLSVDNPDAELCPVHLECQLRAVVGNVLHLEGRCGCWGRPQEPHVADLTQTYRDEARAVMAWFDRRRERTGLPPL